MFGVTFLDQEGRERFAWQTSWGVSTRLIGALIMVHGDDRCIILPPRIAPLQAVIVPIWKIDTQGGEFIAIAQRLGASFAAEGISCRVDERDVRPAWCGAAACEARIKTETKATIRCIPMDAAPSPGACISCGAPSTHRPVFALAY